MNFEVKAKSLHNAFMLMAEVARESGLDDCVRLIARQSVRIGDAPAHPVVKLEASARHLSVAYLVADESLRVHADGEYYVPLSDACAATIPPGKDAQALARWVEPAARSAPDRGHIYINTKHGIESTQWACVPMVPYTAEHLHTTRPTVGIVRRVPWQTFLGALARVVPAALGITTPDDKAIHKAIEGVAFVFPASPAGDHGKFQMMATDGARVAVEWVPSFCDRPTESEARCSVAARTLDAVRVTLDRISETLMTTDDDPSDIFIYVDTDIMMLEYGDMRFSIRLEDVGAWPIDAANGYINHPWTIKFYMPRAELIRAVRRVDAGPGHGSCVLASDARLTGDGSGRLSISTPTWKEGEHLKTDLVMTSDRVPKTFRPFRVSVSASLLLQALVAIPDPEIGLAVPESPTVPLKVAGRKHQQVIMQKIPMETSADGVQDPPAEAAPVAAAP